MKIRAGKPGRRRVLATMVGGAAAALSAAIARPVRAQEKASLLAKYVEKAPTAAEDSAWGAADILSLPLAPQAVVKPRIYDAGVKKITVRALYDAERLVFLVEWKDARADTAIGGAGAFRDALALQFPSRPADGIPYFAMGEPDKPVTIYQWKADWQFGREEDVEKTHPNIVADDYPFSGRAAGEVPALSDYGKGKGDKTFHTSWWSGNTLGDPALQARTSVEKLLAAGFGSITSADLPKQDGAGRGEWKDGAWRVLISIPRKQDEFSFTPGLTLPLAFAAWDGGKGERGGEKAVSTWYFVSLERPVGSVVFWGPVLALIGAAAAQAVGIRYLRRKAERNRTAAR